jgi:hypothetical protein
LFSLFLIPLCLFILFSCSNPTGDDPVPERARQLCDDLNGIDSGSAEVDSGNSASVNVIKDLTLTTTISVPAGVTLVVTDGKILTVDAGATLDLDLTNGGLALDDGTTLTVNGTVNAKSTTGPESFGIVLKPGPTSATIKGNGTIHLKTPGSLIPIMAGQKLTLDGTVTLDGLSTETTYPGTTTPYPQGIGGDATNNTSVVVHVEGELDMKGGTITGNNNTDPVHVGGGGVRVGNESTAKFIMSGGVITGNKTARNGGGVNVHSGTFIMQDSAEISGNSAAGSGKYGGGVCVRRGGRFTMQGGVIKGNNAVYGGGVGVEDDKDDGTSFTMEGGTIYGDTDHTSGNGDATDNTASNSSGGNALYVGSGTAKWGANTTTRTIGNASSGTQGGNIISPGNAEDDTIYAESP